METRSQIKKRKVATTPEAVETESVSSNRGVQLHIQKQLAEDIEAHGGIEEFIGSDNTLYYLLEHLVATNPISKSIYKDNTSEEGKRHRQKIQTLVYTWQKNHQEGEYESKVLNKFGIVPALFRPTFLPFPKTHEEKKQLKREKPDSPFSSRNQQEESFSSPVPVPKYAFSPSPVPSKLTFSPNPSKYTFSPSPVPPRTKSEKKQETDISCLIGSFSNMSVTVNEAFQFQTPPDMPVPTVDNRTGKEKVFHSPLVFTLCIFYPA